MSEAACGEGNTADREEGEGVWLRPAAQVGLLAFILHGPADLLC